MSRKFAVIIGGSGGVGLALTKLCLMREIDVLATYYRNNESLTDLQPSASLRIVQFDFGKDQEALLSAVREYGVPPFLVVNCASTSIALKRFVDFSATELASDLHNNLYGPVSLLQSFLKIFIPSKQGVFIQLLSKTITTNPARMSLYTAAKAGLDSVIRSAGKELAGTGVRLIGISPGYIDTKLIKGFPPKMLEIERESRVTKSLLQPEEAAHMIIGIVDAIESYQSGEVLSID